MSRNARLLGLMALVVVAAGVGWFFGSQIRSPAEVAAEAQPPPASNITVEVVRQALSADVITRGDVIYSTPEELVLSGSFADQPERLVATQTIETGTELAEGDMVVEVVGRPVFLLGGEIPMYRDLRPGSTGDDVAQLEEALARLGFLDEAPDDSWEDLTGAAVAAWYEAAGYRANGLSDDDEETLRAARERVSAAESAVAAAQAAVADARMGASESAILAAEGELKAAEDALTLTSTDAEWANEDAADALNEAATAYESAVQDLETAKNDEPPLSAEELSALEDAVATAEETVQAAQRNAARVAIEQDSLVSQAETRVEVAAAALAELRLSPDTSALQRQVDTAREELDAAQQGLAALESALGTWLPAGELIFVDGLPVRVDEVAASRGDEIAGPFATVTGSVLTIQAAVSQAEASLLQAGMPVEIENPDDGTMIAGTIGVVAEDPGSNGVAADRVPVEIIPEELPEEIIGDNVRIVIPVTSTAGEVLAVPAAALYATADGSIHLELEGDDGSLRSVTVQTGLAADGLVEITPLGGDIGEGDLVVVGRADGNNPGGAESVPPDSEGGAPGG